MAIQTEVHRKLTGAERLRLAAQMSAAVRELAATRLRMTHGDWSDSEIKRELLRYAFIPGPIPPPLR